MVKIGCKPNFIEILKDFMENRKLQIEYKGVKLTKFCTAGQGQGSCISPWAFCIVADQLLNAFADDLWLAACGTDLQAI